MTLQRGWSELFKQICQPSTRVGRSKCCLPKFGIYYTLLLWFLKFVVIIVLEDGNLIPFQGYMLLFIITIPTKLHLSLISVSCLNIFDILICDDPVINDKFLWFVFLLVFYLDIYIYSLLCSIPAFLLAIWFCLLPCYAFYARWNSLRNVQLKFYFFFCFLIQCVRSSMLFVANSVRLRCLIETPGNLIVTVRGGLYSVWAPWSVDIFCVVKLKNKIIKTVSKVDIIYSKLGWSVTFLLVHDCEWMKSLKLIYILFYAI